MEVIRDAVSRRGDSWTDTRTEHEAIADGLLARGFCLPGEATMAWAVVGEDGKPEAGSVTPFKREALSYCEKTEQVVRVAIRVVEGGDDAA